MRRAGAAAAVFLQWLLAATAAAAAQEPAATPFVPPSGGSWEPIRSIGQPSRWLPFLGAGMGVDAPLRPGEAGVSAAAGVYRDLVNPVLAMLGLAGEVYAGQRGERLDVGARLHLVSPAFYVRAGMDWNQRLGRLDAAFALTLPPRRGGWFGQGGQLRFDYVPAREHSIVAGVEVPLGQRLTGRTRPRGVAAPLPSAPVPPPAEAAARAAASGHLAAMRWITLLQTFTWRMGDGPLAHDAAARHARDALQGFAVHVAAPLRPPPQSEPSPDAGPPSQPTSAYTAVLVDYHRALASAFEAAGATQPGSGQADWDVARDARRIVLEEVVLPYNRLIGQYKLPDGLHGLAARARTRFRTLLLLRDMPSATVDATMRVFDGWLHSFEMVRAELARETGDSRVHWLPLSLVLTPEEHATQAQVDALVETALGRPFSSGNDTRYIDAVQFQTELTRTIRAAEAYHVLWVHDYRGRDVHGQPDRTGFLQTTDGYLRALLERVRAYDATGRLPVYIMMIDQHSYEEHDARLWLDLLERPLTHQVQLPARAATMQHTIDALQDSLRAAVAGSRRLSAEAADFGSDWIEQTLKVHVNVTFPSDPSYRAPRVLRLPFAGDNLMRDHRKIVIRDITEADPGAGEIIITGVGVGDHYATARWDDRALVLSGPAALEARHAARAVLEAHGLGGASMPPPLRPRPLTADHDMRMAERTSAGAAARVLQVHNRTGFGDKDATFVQMLLYDLAPAGTVIYVPDSLWLSFERLGQLLAAALRGCHVILVMPALDNAPNTGFPQLSRMQELVTRAVIVQQQLGPLIRAGGGDFRVGLYARRAPLDDVAGVVAELEDAFARSPFLAALFPLSDDAWSALRSLRHEFTDGSPRADDVEAGRTPRRAPTDGPAGVTPPIVDDRYPMLHRKTQLLASSSALAALSVAPGLGEAFTAKLRARRQVTAASPASPASTAATLPALGRAAMPSRHHGDDVLYLLAGTMNMDPRSVMLDGEATAVVAGDGAAQAFMDFVLLSGGVTWVESVDDAAALLPPLPRLHRWIGRLLHPVL